MSTRDDAVRQLLDQLAAAYRARDPERALELFADDAVFVGTGPDELRFGQAELKEQISRDLTQADELSPSVSNVRVAGPNGEGVAWFDAHLALDVIAGGESFTMPMRVTGVATTDGARWRFCQTHFSLPFAEQAEGASFAPGS
jgi:uncharacterized protein (TIGR02246 family)